MWAGADKYVQCNYATSQTGHLKSRWLSANWPQVAWCFMFKTAQGIRFCNYPPKFKIPKPTFDLIVFCLPGKRRLSQCTQFWFGLMMACTFNVELSLNGFYFPHVPLCPVGKPLRAFLLAPNGLQNSSHCPAIEQTHIYIKQLFMSF